MSTFVTLTQAKSHLGITGSSEDTRLQECLDASEAMVLGYIENPGPSPSPLISRAILEQCAEFNRFRGDDEDGHTAPKPDRDGEPSPFVKRLLYRFRRTPIP